MALYTHSTTVFLTSLVLSLFMLRAYSSQLNVSQDRAPKSDVDLLELELNLKYLSAGYFLYGATGSGLDANAPQLTNGGPPPIGAKKANLDPFTEDIISQFALTKIGHMRAIYGVVNGFPRPLLNLSRELFGELVDEALGKTSEPSFDPYANPLNNFLGAYVISYIAPTAYVGITPQLQNATYKSLVARLLGIEFGQDAVVRTYLYERRNFLVLPYGVTVTEFTNSISELGNKLGKEGTKSEGLVVPRSQGAEGRITGNVLAADQDSLAYSRNERETLRVVYGSGNESVPGGFYPNGANGRIAKSFLSSAT